MSAKVEKIEYKKYIPEYKSRGIVPEQVSLGTNQPIVSSARRQPNMEMVVPSSHLHHFGNEPTFSSLDGEVVDDISQEIDHDLIIDNNDFVYPDMGADAGIEDRFLFSSLQDDEYVLLINDAVFSAGSFTEIQEEVKSLLYNDHQRYQNNKRLSPDDLTVLKKVKIKIGVFLDQGNL